MMDSRFQPPKLEAQLMPEVRRNVIKATSRQRYSFPLYILGVMTVSLAVLVTDAVADKSSGAIDLMLSRQRQKFTAYW